jgi:hypothetical protein
MIEFIKAAFKSWLRTTGSRYIEMIGRGAIEEGQEDELLEGKLFQHAGLRTFPGPGTEFATIKNGTNVWIVSENDLQFQFTINNTTINPQIGDVLLYQSTTGNPFIYLTQEDGSPEIFVSCGETTINVSNSGVTINGTGLSTAQPIATQAFVEAVTTALNSLGVPLPPSTPAAPYTTSTISST